MKLVLSGAMLLALTLPAFAGPSLTPSTGALQCLPYAEAMKLIVESGGTPLGEADVPFVPHAQVLFYAYNGMVAAVGVEHEHGCILLDPAPMGRLGIDPRRL